jgi:hypothetical protein
MPNRFVSQDASFPSSIQGRLSNGTILGVFAILWGSGGDICKTSVRLAGSPSGSCAQRENGEGEQHRPSQAQYEIKNRADARGIYAWYAACL